MGKKKGVWIQVEREKVYGSKGKEKRCLDPMRKRKREREKVFGSNEIEERCVDQRGKRIGVWIQ